MFMLTAVGTAVILEETAVQKVAFTEEKHEIVGVDRVNALRHKKSLIEKAEAGNLVLSDEVWSFLTTNQVYEIFPFILKKFAHAIVHDQGEVLDKFYKQLLGYLDVMPDNKKLDLMYTGILEDEKGGITLKLSEIIRDLQLFDFTRNRDLLNNDTFEIQRRAVRLTTYDKPFYNKQDLTDLESLIEIIKTKFKEKGTRLMKKSLLSSKEKEMWTCQCGKTNDISVACSGCDSDIYGFKSTDISPAKATALLRQKINLIAECIN